MRDTWLDIRYALRGFVRSPAFAAAAICSMAVGIGANAAVFSVFSAVLLRPFPYPEPDGLVSIYETNAGGGGVLAVSPPDFLDWRAGTRSLRAVAAYRSWAPNLTGVDQAERLDGLRVSGDFFGVLGTQPILGRSLTADDERLGSRAVVISETLWSRLYGRDPSIAGQSMRMDGAAYEIAGVMPSSLQFPHNAVDVWAPLDLERERSDRDEHSLLAVGRLNRGASLEQARSELRGLSVRHEAESGGHVVDLASFRDWFVGRGSRGLLWMLLGAVGLLLLIACANVANLLVARGDRRADEMMIRTAIGATRARLIRQLMTESLLLAAISGYVGVLLSMWSVRGLLAALPPASVYRQAPVAMDWRVFAFAVVVSTLAGLLFGVLPALRHSRPRPLATYGVIRSTPLRIRALLLASQAALAVTLLASAAMLGRGFLELWRTDRGFSSDGVTTARVTMAGVGAAEAAPPFFERIVAQLTADPAIVAAAAVTHVPMSGVGNSGYVTIEGREHLSADASTRPGAARFIVTDDYFRALSIPALRGRLFSPSDTLASPPVVIVNEAMARRYWRNDDPVGRRIKRGTPTAPFAWLTIVGVIGDVRQQGLNSRPGPTIYLPLPQSPERSMTLLVKSRLSDAEAGARIRAAVRAVDRDQPVGAIRSLDAIVFGSVTGRWLPAMWVGIFSGLALALAVLGVYGVVTYAVAHRRREFGIRLALGASRPGLVRIAIRQGLVPVLCGIAVGLTATALLARVNARLLGMPSLEPWTIAGVAALLVLFTIAASYLPARRITADDAARSLRHE
jgi:putative ABC transport system permease protein